MATQGTGGWVLVRFVSASAAYSPPVQVADSDARLRRWSGTCLLLSVLIPARGAEPAWQTISDGRLMPVALTTNGRPGFTLLTPAQTGVTFTNVLPASRFLTNQVLPNGSGVAAGDVDGDGWCDLYFCGLSSDNRLYRNLGNWRFEDVTASAGVACPDLDATGTGFADLDGDGDLDLLVNSLGGGTRLFFNTGQGRFTPGSQVLNPGHGGTSLAFADADGDGDLDLYIANYRVTTLMDAPGTRFTVRMVNGQPVVAQINGRPPTDPEWTNRFQFRFEKVEGGRGTFAREELGEADLFLLNDGRGHFEPVSWTGGAFLDEAGEPLRHPPFDWGLSVLFRDLTGDGLPDLYVCNDFGTPDRFWQNVGRGHFRAAPRLALRQTSLASMGVDAADLDRDGQDDFMVVEMLSRDHVRRLSQRTVAQAQGGEAGEITGRPQYPRNTLFWNRGDGTYAEIAQYAGIEASEWSWAPLFVDVDLDGFEDLLIPNGFERDNMNADVQDRIRQAGVGRPSRSAEELRLRGLFPRLDTANLAFRNRGDLRFEDVSRAWGFDTRTISQGACLADLDNDGDLDVVVNNLNAAAGLYRNEGTASRLAARLVGQPPNTRGIGARVTVIGGPQRQAQEITGGGRYLSSDDPQRSFATGTARALTVTVRWPNGRETTLSNVPPNHRVEVIEPRVTTGATAANLVPPRQPPGTLSVASMAGFLPTSQATIRFAEVDALNGHQHEDTVFDDFQRQPLLPRTLSQLGPGVAW